MEKAGYDPRTIDVEAFLKLNRSELRPVSTADIISIMTIQMRGKVSFAHHGLLGYIATFESDQDNMVWSVFDDRFEDALQRLLDQIQYNIEVRE